MKQAVIFGAGNIGRGFIGQLYSESGYHVTFVDIDETVLNLLNERGTYRLQAVFDEQVDEEIIGPVSAIHAGDTEAVIEAVCRAEVAATAVGARALPAVAQAMAAGIEARAEQDLPPLNIILCENLKGAAQLVREMVEKHLTPAAREYARSAVGFVDTVIGRMVPLQTEEQRAADPTCVRVEPYKELPVDQSGIRGEIPTIASLVPVADFGVYTARKLYIHNCGHALFAYRGYQLGYEYGYEALADKRVSKFLFAGWQESLKGIVHHYNADPQWIRDHMEDLFRRFQNKALGDTIFRLARDPVRKLHSSDRLIAPARLAEEAGILPTTLAAGIAAAYRFDAPNDPVAVQLQERLKADGLGPVMEEISEISIDEPLGKAVKAAYDQAESGEGA